MSEFYDTAGEAAVHIGFWTDYDRVPGVTLTLRDRDAVVLVAFLTITATIAGTRSWIIWRFLLHHFRRQGRER